MEDTVNITGNVSEGNASYVVATNSTLLAETGVGQMPLAMTLLVKEQGGNGTLAASIDAPGLVLNVSGVFSQAGTGYYRIAGNLSIVYEAGNASEAERAAESLKRFLNPIAATALLQSLGLPMIRVDALSASVDVAGNVLSVDGSFVAVFDARAYREQLLSGLARAGVLKPDEVDRLRSAARSIDELGSVLDRSQRLELVVDMTSGMRVDAKGVIELSGPRENVERVLAYNLFGGFMASLAGITGGGSEQLLIGARLVEEGIAVTVAGDASLELVQENDTLHYRVEGVGFYKPGASPEESAEAALRVVAELLQLPPLGVQQADITLESQLPLQAPNATRMPGSAGAPIYVAKLSSTEQLLEVKLGEAETARKQEATSTAMQATTVANTTAMAQTGTHTATETAAETPTERVPGNTTTSAHEASTTTTTAASTATTITGEETAGTPTAAPEETRTSTTPAGMSPAALTAGFTVVAAVLIALGYMARRKSG
ncbi:hypothetical protein PABY_18840 [Pyrodictium abyssi]|uniref:Uncharacterized protein n=2 Tax=Pyrodictium abyssi TaxID=54256 RepID=A0ABM8IXP8_9CREN|nr:hypothetical protein PABY_18840 [Pyrodictium abyssi]